MARTLLTLCSIAASVAILRRCRNIISLPHCPHVLARNNTKSIYFLDPTPPFHAAGDSRALLIRSDGSFIPLSSDHKPSRRDEVARIALVRRPLSGA